MPRPYIETPAAAKAASFCQRLQGIPLKAFDWRTAIQFKINKPNWDHDSYNRLALLSSQWVTCACGNLCEIIPRRSGGSPKDEALRDLGYKFNTAISVSDWPQALIILDEIEARSEFLIKEILSDAKKDSKEGLH